MHVFLSALEGAVTTASEGRKPVAEELVRRGVKLKFNLVSYYALDKSEKHLKIADFLKANSEEMMVDSGAHSFQKGKKVSWDEYTERYADFIRRYDAPNVVGFFEMDVDKVIGLEKVYQLRSVLERVTDKIIPVWHKGRGLDNFKQMCDQYHDRVVAITGFRNEDIKDEQYPMFLKYAWKHNCRVHCLGMTRRAVLEKVPFDYTDSSTWLQRVLYGMVENNSNPRVANSYIKEHRGEVYVESYMNALREVKYYQEMWGKYEDHWKR